MSAQVSSPEITVHHEHTEGTGRIWKAFWILSILTIIELSIGLTIYNIHKGQDPNESLVFAFKGLICILTLAKAFYIVSIFMHLGDEIRNLIMTIVTPLCLFIWFITAFLYEGNSWKNMRNTARGNKPATEQVAPAAQQPGAKD